MKITQKQIEEMISDIAGPEGLPVYKALKDKENVNEFLIAEKLHLTINQIRNILYKFDAHNLVASTRKKDRKKGWYIYFWTFLGERAGQVYVSLKRNRMKHLQVRLEREKAHEFYLCVNRCTRVSVEAAMENQFMCVECGQLMGPEDNTKTINRIQKEIEDLETEVGRLETPEKVPVSEKKAVYIAVSKRAIKVKKKQLA